MSEFGDRRSGRAAAGSPRSLMALTPAHFALYRASLDGLDEATLRAPRTIADVPVTTAC